jgi:hypothetical protein
MKIMELEILHIFHAVGTYTEKQGGRGVYRERGIQERIYIKK